MRTDKSLPLYTVKDKPMGLSRRVYGDFEHDILLFIDQEGRIVPQYFLRTVHAGGSFFADVEDDVAIEIRDYIKGVN